MKAAELQDKRTPCPACGNRDDNFFAGEHGKAFALCGKCGFRWDPEPTVEQPTGQDGLDAHGRYRTIVADPPWEIPAVYRQGGRRARKTEVPYSMLSLEDIAALRVVEMAEAAARLFLWSTRRVFREGAAARIARAWGFEPVSEIIWGLRNPGITHKNGRARANDHEPVLVAERGSIPPLAADAPLGVIFWRQPYAHGKIHSAKPDGFLDLVEQVSPGPYLEMFARRQRLGWDTWGDEALNHVLGGPLGRVTFSPEHDVCAQGASAANDCRPRIDPGTDEDQRDPVRHAVHGRKSNERRG